MRCDEQWGLSAFSGVRHREDPSDFLVSSAQWDGMDNGETLGTLLGTVGRDGQWGLSVISMWDM